MYQTLWTFGTLALIIGWGDTSLAKYGTACGDGTEEADGVCESGESEDHLPDEDDFDEYTGADSEPDPEPQPDPETIIDGR